MSAIDKYSAVFNKPWLTGNRHRSIEADVNKSVRLDLTYESGGTVSLSQSLVY